MQNWLNIQRNIGIDKVTLYFASNTSKVAEKSLKEKFGNYIEIIDYRLDFQLICKFQIQFYSENINLVIAAYLYQNCEKWFNVYFNMSIPGSLILFLLDILIK